MIRSSITERQSTLITTMRFPLIVLVLIEHSVRTDRSPMRWSLDNDNVYHFVTEMVSHHLCSIAVCCFFVLSGFLFFSNVKEEKIGNGWFLEKWGRRMESLVVPYLIWNLLFVGVILLVSAIFKSLGIIPSYDAMEDVRKGPLSWFVTGPIDYPLWYVRDLIVDSVLAPLIYLCIKAAPKSSLAALVLLHFSPVVVRFSLFPSLALFGLGAWMGIHKTDFLSICQRVKYPAAVLAILLAFLATCLYGSSWHLFVRLLFFPFGMITFTNLCDWMIQHQGFEKALLQLSETVFFIYAVHEVYILGWTKGSLLRLFGDGPVGQWIVYLVAPVVTLLICLALFYLFKKLTPRILDFVCGARTQQHF